MNEYEGMPEGKISIENPDRIFFFVDTGTQFIVLDI